VCGIYLFFLYMFLKEDMINKERIKNKTAKDIILKYQTNAYLFRVIHTNMFNIKDSRLFFRKKLLKSLIVKHVSDIFIRWSPFVALCW